MNRELTVTPFLINHQTHPSPHSWVKLLIYEPTEAEVVATRGKMYAVLSLSSKTEIDFTPIMQLIIETLQQRYFGQTEGGILQTLETALDAIHKQLLLAGQQDKRLSAGFSFDILVAVSWGTVLYISQLGSSRACLLRQDKLHDIDQGDQKTTSMYLSSGVVQAGDRFILATGQLLKKFSHKQLQHHLALPESTLLQSIEQQASQEPDSLESGLLLVVDIKQVPSIEDESLQILNADTLSAVPRLSSTLQSLNSAADSTIAGSKSMISWLWRWKIFGRIPGFPLIIILLCLCLLLGSIAFKYFPKSQPSTDITPIVNQLQGQLDQAEQIASINPDRAESILGQMEPALTQAIKDHPDDKLTAVATQRQQLLDQLLNIQILTPHPLAQISGTVSQMKLALLNKNVYVINSQQRQLLRVSNDTLQTVATDEQVYAALAHLVATSQGLVAIRPQIATPISISGTAGEEMTIAAESIISTTSFMQNAYALTQDGQLYRIANQGGQLADASAYFSPAIAPDNLKDVAIDGDVYILRADGSVEKYVSGQRKTLTLERSGLLKNMRAIFTDSDSDNLYFLADHSLLVWSKAGQYLGQFRLSGTATWQAATVDAPAKTLYILSEGKLIEATLSL